MMLPREIGVMTLSGVTLFPNALLPLYIFEPRYRRMLANALESHRMFCVAMQKPECTRETPTPVAGLGLIRVSVQHRDGTSHLVLQGLCRVELGQVIRYRPYRVQLLRELSPVCDDAPEVDALVSRVRELAAARLELGLPATLGGLAGDPPPGASAPTPAAKEMLRYLAELRNPDHLADMVASTVLQCARERQALLATPEVLPRLRLLVQFLKADIHRQKQIPKPES